MAVEIGVFRLIREALYFVSLIFSSQRTRELYELFWELQIDVSIIYSFLKKLNSYFYPERRVAGVGVILIPHWLHL